MNNRQLFQQHLAPTSPAPVGLEITSASGNYLYGVDGKAYLDIIGGISVCNIGHCHPAVVKAIQDQSQQYLHIMVYGELVQSPQVKYAQALAAHLPANLDCVYFTNSGSEATDGALKLARRYTGRTDVICCNNSYHGHTIGALSVMGDEYWRNAFRPLLPGVWHYDYNADKLINAINEQTSCVIVETIQAEAGVITPKDNWLQRLRTKCTEMGALLIFDEIQCGFGRTGKLWGFEHYNVIPDIVLLGKALGGGMPLGAFISSNQIMTSLSADPVLGHISTFGGHPVCCAAGMASLQALDDEHIVEQVANKEQLFLALLKHPAIKEVRSAGLLMAVDLDNAEHVQETLHRCLDKGLFSDWFLFAPGCIRIAPPLTITEEEIEKACAILLSCL
ncbi:aspartate aminotransferase family protein [Flavipsychrobacter stenotrophus]|uniref:Aspartate aminotransferase family protein n=1 Tax=Flavipsychrobacter stenotrophus TaxID=2077091 RepID=A0A2S7SVP3_9BACT|nr:aspartate aminotransferase family protein [Flavipsychrobacter stenotrophus]PQJ10989.1 aspartate aminotransferase family protein [Flavipsychrobacter stenotrophus]